ncbi:unnamed protein product [Prunus brigantina]
MEKAKAATALKKTMEKAEQLLLIRPKMKMKKVECVCGGGRKDFGQSRISTSRPSLLLQQRKQKGRGGGRRAGVILYVVEVELLDLNGFLIAGCCEIMWDAKGAVAFFSQVNVASKLLVQLSGSSCCNGGSTEEESESKSRAAPLHHDDDQVSSSFSKYETLVSEEDEDEERFEPRKRRFRSISELYELTEPPNLFIVAKETQGKRRKIMSN